MDRYVQVEKMKLRQGNLREKPREVGRLRAATRTIVKKMEWVAAPVLAAGLLLSSANAKAEEGQQPAEDTARRPSFTASFTGGAYDQASSPVLGAGMSMSYQPTKRLTVDAIASAVVRVDGSNALELDELELDLTTPIAGPVSATALFYRSQYYDVLWGAGVNVHVELPRGFALHFAPQLNNGPLVALPLSVTSDVGPVTLMLGVVPIANHSMLESPAPLIGADASITVHIGNMDVFVRGFEMTTMDSDRNLGLGVLNVQGGLKLHL
jgi:hypothetical protein